jgi:hypothetical protein
MSERRKHKKSRTVTKQRSAKKWSGRVTRESHTLDLDGGVFTWKNPKRIARSLKHSAEASHRRKANPYRSAMSMLVFYINRAGDDLPRAHKKVLEQAKNELRKLFGRKPG